MRCKDGATLGPPRVWLTPFSAERDIAFLRVYTHYHPPHDLLPRTLGMQVICAVALELCQLDHLHACGQSSPQWTPTTTCPCRPMGNEPHMPRAGDEHKPMLTVILPMLVQTTANQLLSSPAHPVLVELAILHKLQ